MKGSTRFLVLILVYIVLRARNFVPARTGWEAGMKIILEWFLSSTTIQGETLVRRNEGPS